MGGRGIKDGRIFLAAKLTLHSRHFLMALTDSLHGWQYTTCLQGRTWMSAAFSQHSRHSESSVAEGMSAASSRRSGSTAVETNSINQKMIYIEKAGHTKILLLASLKSGYKAMLLTCYSNSRAV